MGKLVLSRRVGERIAIDETTFVSVERIRGDYVRLGFEAPRHVRIVRDELDRIDDAKPTESNVTSFEWKSGPPEAVNNKEFLIDANGVLFIAVRYHPGTWWCGSEAVSKEVQSASRHVLLSDLSWHRPDEWDRTDVKTTLVKEYEFLLRWKKEAGLVLNEWEKCFDALPEDFKPLGVLKPRAVLDYITNICICGVIQNRS